MAHIKDKHYNYNVNQGTARRLPVIKRPDSRVEKPDMAIHTENVWKSALCGAVLYVAAFCAGVVMPVVPPQWSANVAVMLYDSLQMDFSVQKQENTADIREVRWYRVRHTAPCDLSELKFWDSEFIETRPVIRVVTFDSAGRSATVDNDNIKRDRTSEEPDARYNLYVDKTGTFVTTVTIPSFDRVRYIRTEIRRSKVKPVFLGRFVLRTRYPTLSKVVRIRVPVGMEGTVGMSNGEGLSIDSARISDASATMITYSSGLLNPVPEKPILYPESWLAGVELRLPPHGTGIFSWKDIGDYYLDMIQTRRQSSPAVDSVAARLPSAPGQAVSAAYDFVKQHLRYYGNWEGKRGFVPRECGEVLQKGYGDCKELSMLLCALLTAKGLTAFPALVSARPTFMQMNSAFPSLGVFNHMIVALPGNGTYKYLDATVTFANSDNSYYPVLNRKTLILRRSASCVDSVMPGPQYVNEIVSESSIIPAAGGQWRLQGAIRQYGLSAFDLYHALSGRLSHSEDAILSRCLWAAFGIRASEVKIVSRSLDSICLSFSCSFEEYATRVPKQGFIIAVPMLHRGYAMEEQDVAEGPWESPLLTQRDTWCGMKGMTKTSFTGLSNPVAQGAWKAAGDTIVRQFTGKRTVFPSASETGCRAFIRERNKFEKASVWKD
jgi:transglutaminase-like putative cysteine protease